MNKFSKTIYKSYLSTWFLGSFLFIMAIVAVGTELFQLAPKGQKELSVYSNPLKADILSNLKSMVISNKLGSFTIAEEKSGWMLKEPRQMPLKIQTKDKIFESLKNIIVKNLHQYEPLNISNFSLDKPVFTLKLYTKLDETIELKVGLINPINNTTYLVISNQKQIFQTDILMNNLEALDLGDFIDANVFSIKSSELVSFKIYSGKSNQSLNELSKVNGTWKSKKYNTISDENTLKTIDSILNIKAQYIVDGQDPETQNTINNYLDNPIYTVKVNTTNKEVSYIITGLVKSLPGLKLDKRQHFIIQASDRKFPMIVAKDNLNLFQIRYSKLR